MKPTRVVVAVQMVPAAWLGEEGVLFRPAFVALGLAAAEMVGAYRYSILRGLTGAAV